MILKERQVPDIVEKLEALLRRLPPDHAKKDTIDKELARYTAGYAGELRLNYPLSFLDNNYYTLHDVRIFDGSHYVQMDTSILHQCCFFILEV